MCEFFCGYYISTPLPDCHLSYCFLWEIEFDMSVIPFIFTDSFLIYLL